MSDGRRPRAKLTVRNRTAVLRQLADFSTPLSALEGVCTDPSQREIEAFRSLLLTSLTSALTRAANAVSLSDPSKAILPHSSISERATALEDAIWRRFGGQGLHPSLRTRCTELVAALPSWSRVALFLDGSIPADTLAATPPHRLTATPPLRASSVSEQP